MQIEVIHKCQLKGFVSGELFQKLSHLPLSSLRAHFLMDYRHALDDDVLIVLVRERYELLGFAAFLPDVAHNGQRFAWNSGWWVNPERGRPTALISLLKGIELWGERVAFADLPYRSATILATLKRFSFLPSAQGLKLILRPYAPAGVFNKSVARAFDVIAQWVPFAPFYNFRKFRSDLRHIVLSEINFNSMVAEFDQIGLTHRDAVDFEHIINHPWLTNNINEYGSEIARYPFSMEVGDFGLSFFELLVKGELKGVVLLKIRDGHMAVPYLWIKEGCLDLAAQSIIKQSLKLNCKSVTVFRSDACEAFMRNAPITALRKHIGYQTCLSAGIDIGWIRGGLLQDGEGDCIFT